MRYPLIRRQKQCLTMWPARHQEKPEQDQAPHLMGQEAISPPVYPGDRASAARKAVSGAGV